MTDNAKELLEDLRTLTNNVLLDLVAENEDLEEQLENKEIDFIQPKKTVGKLISIDVLDKIRAEIEEYRLTIDKAISEDELKIEGMKEAYLDCLEIIDKYKVESEDV